MLEIQRQIRSSLYDVHFRKPAPLVPRYRCRGVPERLDGRGRVVEPLDEAAVAPGRRGAAGGGGAVRGRLPPPFLPQSGTRGEGGRDPSRGLSLPRRFPLLRDRPGLPRVLPRQHHGDQRRDPARGGQLPAAHRVAPAPEGGVRLPPPHAEQRRRLHLRGGGGEARVHGGVRARRRGHRRQLPRRRARQTESPVLRHGGNHGEDRADPGGRPPNHQGVRGGQRRQSQRPRGQGGEDTRSGPRSSTWWRSAPAAARWPGWTAPACCASVPQRRGGSRPGVLRRGRDRAHNHRRQPGPGAHRPGLLPRR